MDLPRQRHEGQSRSVFLVLLESLQLARQVFFKPFTLDEELRKAGPCLATNVPIWRVRSGLTPDERYIVAPALVAVALGAIVWPFLAGLGTLWMGYPLRWLSIFLVTLTGLSFGVAGLLFVGISFGTSMGGIVSLAGSLGLVAIAGVKPSLTLIEANRVTGAGALGLGSGLVLGSILGLAAIVTFPLRPAARWFGGVCAVGGGLVFGISSIWMAGGGTGVAAMGVTLAVFFALGFLIGYSFLGYQRLLIYPVELVWQIGLTGLGFLAIKIDDSGRWINRLYRLSSVRHDELIWFKLWTLDKQLSWLAIVGDRQFALEAIVEVARSFHQGWAAESALATIMAHDLRDCEHIPDIAGAATCLSWFPRAIDLPSLNLQRTVTLLNEVSQNAEAATRALDGFGWPINLRKARANLKALQETLARMNRRVAGPLNPIVQRWQDTIEQALEEAPRDAGPVLIENWYIFGNPITPEREHMFVGREDLFARLQENLAATSKPTLVLHGQRRTGKTSLLLQLPNRLPAEQVPVYVDLQATAPVDGLNRFLYTLAHEAVLQADEKRRIALPSVELADFDQRGTHAFYEWLEQTRQRLGERLLLFTLDEFEKIEEAIGQGRIEVAVLDVLRHLIHHYSPWFVFLFAGVHTLEEMSRDWHSYFISVKPICVSYLDPDAARKLILLPSDTYQIRYDRGAVETILKATHAQPFLVQAVCFELIQHLNSHHRRMAGPFGRVIVDDAQEAIHRGVRSAHAYFYDLWVNSSAPERLVLASLAHSQKEKVRIDNLGKDLGMKKQAIYEAVEQLKRRELIEIKGRESQFQVPMVRQWIRDEQSLEAVRLASQPPLGY